MNFRCIQSHDCKLLGHPKYMMWPGLDTNLYNVKVIDEAKSAIAVAEGELDALSSTLAGIPAVGVAGATKWQEHWNNVFEDFERVYVWQEGDEAGVRFGDRLVSEVAAIRVVLPHGEDVNSIWVAQGASALRARIRT